MLPYTPLHHLVLREGRFRALVMTSANRTDEPIAYLDDDATLRLRGIADFFLCHDRRIETPCDDSVLRSVGPRGGDAIPLRRSRGYAPQPFKLPLPVDCPTLAVGAELKSTFALAAADRAVLSHHLGDLDHYSAYRAYEAAVKHYERIYQVAPRRIVHDLHPDYASTRYAIARARRTNVELLAVQHHHAHMASCMVEHGFPGPVIGVCFDGAGLGTDRTIWGGEFLVGGYREVSRVAHLRQVRMPGGDAAAREPWRMAIAHLVAAGEDGAESAVSQRMDPTRVTAVLTMLQKGFNAPLTSSIGRLFDAVASLAGVCDRATFEGQAAMRLEALAAGVAPESGYEFAWDEDNSTIDPAPLIRAVMEDVQRGVRAATIARRFHTALVDVVFDTCRKVRARTGVNVVVLSGGVFSNAILSAEVASRLAGDGFRIGRHRAVPPNDGGLSLGQMAIAAATPAKEA
jgi:hydrogenase maturation protein HypF